VTRPKGTCDSCKAPLKWAVTRKGHRMPLDPEPVPDGNLVLTYEGDTVIAEGAPTGTTRARYQSHFASCPDREQHRRRGKAS
jgi:hypothetical protein